MKHGRYTVKDYLAEEFDYGGQVLTRGEIIADLRAAGGSPGQIGAYLFGLETSKRLWKEAEMGDETPWSAKRSRDDMQRHLASFARVAGLLGRGLAGKPFHWGDGERQAYTKKAAAMGATLVTRNQIKKRGYELKRGAVAVGTAYFGAPIKKSTELFILEVQCKKGKP